MKYYHEKALIDSIKRKEFYANDFGITIVSAYHPVSIQFVKSNLFSNPVSIYIRLKNSEFYKVDKLILKKYLDEILS